MQLAPGWVHHLCLFMDNRQTCSRPQSNLHSFDLADDRTRFRVHDNTTVKPARPTKTALPSTSLGMKTLFATGLIYLSITPIKAQQVDLSSVDAFLTVATALEAGEEVGDARWKVFDSSAAYRGFATRNDPAIIHSIKTSLAMAFGQQQPGEKDKILAITPDEIGHNTNLLLKKSILTNYLDARDHLDSLRHFRGHYPFDRLADRAMQKLWTFLDRAPDTSFTPKPVYLLFISADGKNKEEALFVDFNLLYKLNEEQRINFLAHEIFHSYREKFENHEFNFKNYLNHCLDAIQNEGIADLIDKAGGYRQFFSQAGETPQMVETWVGLYQQAPDDLPRPQQVILQFAQGTIHELEMEKTLDDVVRFNGHPIGFYMANQIVEAGLKAELMKTFYNPYEFYCLYNRGTAGTSLFRFSDAFLTWLRKETEARDR